MKKPGHVLRASALLGLLGLGLGIACSDQAEGDRCEIENGDADCAAGLICVPGRKTLPSSGSWRAEYNTGLNEAFQATDPNDTTKDRCCPARRDQATHPACVRQSAQSTATPPADSGPEASTATPTTDAASTVDAATVSDASQDAPDAD